MSALDRPIDEMLQAALPDDLPAEARERLAEQLAAFRGRTMAAGDISPRRTRIRSAWWGVGLSAAAVVAVAATLALLARPRASLAEAAQALARRPWVHVTTHRASGRTIEAWYSLRDNIVASRSEDVVEYRDHRLNDFYRYDKKNDVLYRLQEYRQPKDNRFQELATAMTLLAAQERTLEKPLEVLGFLGPKAEGMKVVDQRLDRITDGGQSWFDYHLTVSHPALAAPMHMLFRVDAATKLPKLFRMEGVHQGQSVVDETVFDYPDQGPADIFALGVPESGKLVDRVPQGDLKRILDTIQAGRERMDDYRAIFISRTEPMDYLWWCELPNIWYRKGDKFRSDYTARWQGELKTDPPAAGEDLHAWWSNRVKFFRWYPHYVMHGATSYTAKVEGQKIVDVTKYEYNSRPELVVPVTWSMQPEFACRPPMGIGDQSLDAVLDLHPAEGPEGCVLLTIRRTGDKRVSGAADEYRYWLDPARDYIVRRWDMIVSNDEGQPKLQESDIIEEVARSPGGVWYATKIRRLNTVKFADGTLADQVYYLYVDFDVEFPAGFFDPPQVGEIE